MRADEAFFSRFTQVVTRLRWAAVGLTALLTVAALAVTAARLEFDNSIEYFSYGNEAHTRTLEGYRDAFGRDDLFLILVEGDVFSRTFLERLTTLHREVERLDLPLQSLGERAGAHVPVKTPPSPDLAGFGEDAGGDWGDDEGWGEEAGGTVIEEVTSLINARRVVGSADGIAVRGWIEEVPPDEALPDLRARVLAEPALVGSVVGREGRHAVIAARAAFMDERDTGRLNQAIRDLAADHDQEGFRTRTSGVPEIDRTLKESVERDLRRLTGLSFFVMAGVLWVIFRRAGAVLLSLAVVALASLWTLALMAALGWPVTLLSSIIPAFIACVGMGDSVHVQSVYRDQRALGFSPIEALDRTMRSVGLPVLFTTLTTMAGLLSFNFSGTQAIQEMGLAGAAGVAFAWLHSMVLLPALLPLAPVPTTASRAETRAPDRLDAFLQAATNLSAGGPARRWAVIGASALLVAVSLLGASRIRVYHNPLTWLPPGHPTAEAVRELDAHIGGTASMHVVLDTNTEHGVKDARLLHALDRLAAHALAYRHPESGAAIVTHTTSLADVSRETNRALHGGDPAFFVVPTDQRAASDTLLLFESAGPRELRRLATADLKKTHLTLRLTWLDASSYAPFAAHMDAGAKEIVGDLATVASTGTVFTLLSVVGALIDDLVSSFGAALLLISAMMILLSGSLRLGLLSMVPNLVPIAMIMGFMGFAGIPLDMSNLLLASIVLGIAVDDTIHYVHQFRAHFRDHGDTEAAIQHTIEHAGRAMAGTSVILALGFGVFLASGLASLQRFGILVGATCVLALLADLILTPAVLRLAYGAGTKKESA